MLESFLYAFHAVASILVMLVFGCVIGKKGFFDVYTLKKLNTFSFRVTMCVLMFRNMYAQTSIRVLQLNSVILVMVSLVCITVAGVIAAFCVTRQNNRRGVVIQAAFRSNYAVIGLILSQNLCGAEGAAAAVSLQAPGIFYYNIAAVICLTIFSEREDKSFDLVELFKQIVTNPMIIGIAAGVLCLIVREFIPRDAAGTLVFSLSRDLDFLYTGITDLADMTTPLVLITLGAQLDFTHVGEMRRELITCVLMRLVGAPTIGFVCALMLQQVGIITLTPALVGAFLGFWGTPMAVAGAIMAEEMGGDGALARQCAVWTTALSTFTLFLWILFLRFLGAL